MTSTSAGIHESASTRALGMYDIVALVASYSPVWQPYAQLKTGWENSGLQARGINKLWKEAFEERISISTISGNYLAFSSSDTYLPHPVIKILSASRERLRRVRHLHAMCSLAQSSDYKYIADILAFSAATLTYLGTDVTMLATLAEIPHHQAKVAFGRLKTLRLLLFHEEYAANDVDVVMVQKISDILATMSSLTVADILVEADREQYNGTLGWEALHMLFSIPSAKIRTLELDVTSEMATSSTSLAAVLAHFKPKKFRLELDHTEGDLDLWDVLPPTISHLKYTGPLAGTWALLRILSDPRQLPMLRNVPFIRIAENAWDDYMPQVTKEMVARAIEGMQDRGIEVDAIRSNRLHKLVNA